MYMWSLGGGFTSLPNHEVYCSFWQHFFILVFVLFGGGKGYFKSTFYYNNRTKHVE